MKHLIIYAHPNEQSLNSYFKQQVVQALRQDGHEVQVRDLYQQGFDPVLSMQDVLGQMQGTVEDKVRQEQDLIRWADTLTFIYPIWWTGMPAIMKGYIDRVMSYGFAYRYDQGVQKGLLTGKSAVIINTHGKSSQEYAAVGMDKALSLTSDRGIYTYCGLDVKKHFFFGKADRATPETVADWTREVLEVYSQSEAVV
ncbi:NAD(P)H-dependent oxidoreductase [Telluribacter humicola]|uniref:NAD(P)H-dependent oxidoreductase n=1 Tax=Telluribacter humicola TaxID=1720261 RepID=UPI001A9770D8|nr:NAD(P)H-dependent oxidoreductase [Telluribacter humicola]